MSERIESVNADLHQQVVEIFADIFQLDLAPTTTDVTRDTVELWDSVNHLRLVLELEQVFGITLSDDDVLGMASLRDVEAVLARNGINSASTPA